MLLINAFNDTWLIGLVFFGLHLLLLGYLIDSFAHFPLINYQDYKDIFLMIVLILGVIGELSRTIWLLVKGDKLPAMAVLF